MTTANYDLNFHIVKLLMNEPFFASFSRRINKVKTNQIPTAGVRVNPERAQFELFYNPEFFASLKPAHVAGILMHEFYHIIFEHVTHRAPEGGIKYIDNIAMDLSINCHIENSLPRQADPGPIMPGSDKPMQACIPGEGEMFADLPKFLSYEHYLSLLKKKSEEAKKNGQPDPFADDGEMEFEFDFHGEFGKEGGSSVDSQTMEIAKERLKNILKKAAEDASRSNHWGSVSSSVRKEIMDKINSVIDWRKVLRYFVKTSRRSERFSTPRRINKRFPKVHPGKRVTRMANIAVSIDQSGSVDDQMLATFFSELNQLASFATFTVIPFDTRVAEDKVYVWKKGQTRQWERVLSGGTDFNCCTEYVNSKKFDGHIVLTDLCAPKPIASACQRMWITTKEHAENPYFKTNERIIAIDRK